MCAEKRCRIGVVGGGVSGSTVALKLAEMGYQVQLFEEGPSLVNGPPACHLHAGGNLYREISDEQCLKLLQQSIDTYRLYPHAINLRPTVIAVPKSDQGQTFNLLPRLQKLQKFYAELVDRDPANKLLGDVDQYYKVYSHEKMDELAQKEQPDPPVTLDDWMIPVAKSVNLDDFKTDFIMVQEYGLSLFRASAAISLALGSLDSCKVFTSTHVNSLQFDKDSKQWVIQTQSNGEKSSYEVDYLVNACGYRTGTLDDYAGFKRQRMVEFKSAYIARWPKFDGVWPEIIFHGVRGTSEGMGSLTPYCNGYFQLHGMTEDITLFKGGLVSSCQSSSQPKLCNKLQGKLSTGWKQEDVIERTKSAIDHIARLVPSFATAEVGGRPMYGAQQIPGTDPSLRIADVSFEGDNYARTEIVKWSSALTVANKIADHLESSGFQPFEQKVVGSYSDAITAIPHEKVVELAEKIAVERNYPPELAQDYL